MKHEIPFRVIVTNPLPGVTMQVQKGKSELLLPSTVSASSISFEFDVTVDINEDSLNFLGKYAQGPKDTRFIYVNSGTCAGQVETCWTRRAKLSLMSINANQIRNVSSDPSLCIEATMRGTGRDGGPTCASVKDIEWQVASK